MHSGKLHSLEMPRILGAHVLVTRRENIVCIGVFSLANQAAHLARDRVKSSINNKIITFGGARSLDSNAAATALSACIIIIIRKPDN